MATNFRVLRRFLATCGVRNFGSFSYHPRIDHQRLVTELGDTLDAVCQATGVNRVDVVGHSLGGIIARYLIEMGGGRRVRRLVTLGSHYFTNRLPAWGAIAACCTPSDPDKIVARTLTRPENGAR